MKLTSLCTCLQTIHCLTANDADQLGMLKCRPNGRKLSFKPKVTVATER